MHYVQGQGWSPAQNGQARVRPGRWLVPDGHQADQSAGGAQAVHPAVHPVAGARVSVPRRQLPAAELSEDEARRAAHEALQAEDARRLSDLQAADCAVLLPRQALPGGQVSGAVLSEHQAQAEAAAAAAEVRSSF